MTKILHFRTWISLRPVGQSWSNFLCVASLEVGKGCIMFWGILDQNSGFHGNRKPLLTYNGENDVSPFLGCFRPDRITDYGVRVHPSYKKARKLKEMGGWWDDSRLHKEKFTLVRKRNYRTSLSSIFLVRKRNCGTSCQSILLDRKRNCGTSGHNNISCAEAELQVMQYFLFAEAELQVKVYSLCGSRIAELQVIKSK